MELLANCLGDFAPTNRKERRMIRRHSRLKGREGVFWKKTNRKATKDILLAAKMYERQTRQAGKRVGALGAVALEILEYFSQLVDYKTGRLDPSIETLMARLSRSRDAIVRALKALRTHGFVDWIRRYIPADDPTGRVKVQQTSNAYRLFMPNRARRMMGRYGKAAPIPDDALQLKEQQDAMIEEHRAGLSCEGLALFEVEHDKLRESLARLGRAMDQERESVQRTESLSKNSYNREMDTPME